MSIPLRLRKHNRYMKYKLFNIYQAKLLFKELNKLPKHTSKQMSEVTSHKVNGRK